MELLCHLDRAVVPVYLVLSFLAPLSLTHLWWWKRLASHGKTLLLASPSVSSTACWSVSLKRRERPVSAFNVQSPKFWTAPKWLTLIEQELFRSNGWFYVPKRFFLHFYIVGLTQMGICCLTVAGSKGTLEKTSTHIIPSLSNIYPVEMPSVIAGVLAPLLLEFHLLRRFIECWSVHVWMEQSRMHLGGYALGIIHYLLLPLVFFPLPCGRVGNESYGEHLSETAEVSTAISPSRCVFLIIGTIVCLLSQYEQYQHHCILAELRCHRYGSTSSKNGLDNIIKDSSSPYMIPRGRWFHWVSCPHYLAEILIYLSLVMVAILSDSYWSAITNFPFAATSHQAFDLLLFLLIRYGMLLLWVTVNLLVSAISCHRWYLKQYPLIYPKLNRTAIVPYVL